MAKTTTTKNKDEDKGLDIEKLIAKAVASALDESEKKHEKEIDDLKKQINHTDKEDFDNARVEIMNNTYSTFIMSGRKGKSANVFYKLESYGDTSILDYEEFRNYYSQNSKRFKSGELLITDVIGNITKKDLLERLKLNKLYIGKISFDNYKSILTCDYKEFEDFIEDNPSTFENLLEHSVEMNKKGQFNYGDKQNFFRNKTSMLELFK